jgi:CBS domain containing-hemolysin-like protein
MSARGDAGSSVNLKKILSVIVVGITLIIVGAVDASIVTGAGVGDYILQALNKTGFMIPSSAFLLLTVLMILIGIIVIIKDLLKTF